MRLQIWIPHPVWRSLPWLRLTLHFQIWGFHLSHSVAASPVEKEDCYLASPASAQSERYTVEDQLDQHHSADLCKAITWVRELCGLNPAPSEGHDYQDCS